MPPFTIRPSQATANPVMVFSNVKFAGDLDALTVTINGIGGNTVDSTYTCKPHGEVLQSPEAGISVSIDVGF